MAELHLMDQRYTQPQAHHAVLPDVLFQGLFKATAPVEMSPRVIGA